MLLIEESELKELLENEYRKGFAQCMKLMEQRILLANENGTPLEIAGRVWFIKNDMENLRDIFADLEVEE